jgi:cobalt-zinc-cadmium efflux system outer membrane protein
VQRDVTERGAPTVGWPQSVDEQSASDRTVASILTQELTPETAVQIALLNNRGLRATLEDLGVAQADLMAAGRLHNPTFAASIRWPDHRPRSPNVGLSLVADLLDDLLIPIRKKVAREQLAQAERRVSHEVLALAAEVKTAALNVQGRQQFRARLAAIGEVNAAGADLAQRQYDAGNINRLELVNQQVLAQEAKLALVRTDAQLRADREKLNRLLGLSGGQTGWKMNDEMPALPAQEMTFENLEEIAITQRFDLAAAKSQVSLAETALGLRRKMRFLPASVGLGVETEREVDGSRITGPTLEIGLPIFDQGQADIARLEAERRRAASNYDALTNDIRSEARQARDALLTARETADYFESTLLPQRRLLLRETLLHYNAMQKSNYELLAAKERLLVAERESIEALRDYWIARAELERAIGGVLPAGPPTATKATPKEDPAPDHQHPPAK